MSATKPLESLPPTPYPDQIATLKRQIAELEHDKANLDKAVSESNQRVAEAEKSTAAARAETAAAVQRAQKRYTEKLHANNEARNLQDAMKEQAFKHNDSSIKTSRRMSCLEAKIAHLETEVSIKDTKIQELEEELRETHTGFLGNQQENVEMETQLGQIVHDLKNKIIGLEKSLAAAEQDKEQAVKDKDAIAKSQAKFEVDQAYFKSREIELMRTNQIKLQHAHSHWHSKLEIMMKKLKEARREAEEAKQKLQMATHAMQNTAQKPGVAQQQQRTKLQTSNSNRRIRSSPNRDNETAACAFQRAQNQTLLLNIISLNQNLLTRPNEDIPETEAQPIPRQPMNMAQDIGYMQYPSTSFNSSASPNSPIPTDQQQYSSAYGQPSVQQHGVPMQPMRSMGQQQSMGPLSPQQQQPGLVHNARLNNAGSPAPTHSNHGINMNLAVNTGTVQQPHRGMIQQPPPAFIPSRTHESSSTNASFFPNTQGSAGPSTYGNDIFATESSNIDYFMNNDLEFTKYPMGSTFQDPLYSNDFTQRMNGNAQGQGDGNAAPADTNATWSGGQGPAPHGGYAPR
ncbi:hypothetical protein COCMIDRAFT_80308 [Bipolaris oryzae ATCC 44560]|uniref:Uncharacterized protein n=1 Tax=Bipolaris oryzae ATCC 44560 TaxID=930090 RepID=W6ZM23_COCMI|nr:uncharacterized protein COCMIDRAFT_80308 [Bipolaris oryzae ATCC 44560]EUC51028.1 hypothetical protein COCMIDRAFT_80308 [Bipolaris oryzae ATCC 44560]